MTTNPQDVIRRFLEEIRSKQAHGRAIWLHEQAFARTALPKAAKVIAACIEGFEGDYQENFWDSPLAKEIARLIQEDQRPTDGITDDNKGE